MAQSTTGGASPRRRAVEDIHLDVPPPPFCGSLSHPPRTLARGSKPCGRLPKITEHTQVAGFWGGPRDRFPKNHLPRWWEAWGCQSDCLVAQIFEATDKEQGTPRRAGVNQNMSCLRTKRSQDIRALRLPSNSCRTSARLTLFQPPLRLVAKCGRPPLRVPPMSGTRRRGWRLRVPAPRGPTSVT